MLKGVFYGFYLKIKDSNIGHFNIPKFYTLIYFKENIRLYGCTDGYYTSVNNKARHYYIIKAFYDLINKRDSLS